MVDSILFYTTYKITNNINGKIYIGCHKTEDIDDGYMGSGKLIKRAIIKYGLENFSKDILATFESEEQMFDEEMNLISKIDPEYNLHPGGNGGFSYINQNKLNNKDKNYNGVSSRMMGHKMLPQTKKALLESHKNRPRELYQTFLGKSHSSETKQKMSDAKKGKGTGESNSQFGLMWITNGVENKKIKKLDIIPEGWYKGRKIK